MATKGATMLSRLIRMWYLGLPPIKAKSLAEFTRKIKEKESRVVVIYVNRRPIKTSKNPDLEEDENYEYGAGFVSRTARWRMIIYEIVYFKAFVSEYGLTTPQEINANMIKNYLLAEKDRDKIEKALPEITAIMVGPNNEPMDEAMMRKLHADAEALGIGV